MKSQFIIPLITVLLLTTSGLSYISSSDKSENARNSTYVSGLFKKLEVQHASIEKEALKLNSNRSNNFDALVEVQANQHKTAGSLKQSIDEYLPNSTELTQALQRYKQAYLASDVLISHLKRLIAVSENSLNYSIFLSDQLLMQLSHDSETQIYLMVNQLVTSVVHQYVNLKPPSAKETEEIINEIKVVLTADSPAHLGSFTALSRHLKVVANNQLVIDKTLEYILSSPHSSFLSAAYENYQHEQAALVSKQQIYATTALLSLSFLLLSIAYATFRFVVQTGRLSSENKILEHEITESKAILKQSNNELKKEIEQRKLIESELKDAAIFYDNCAQGVVICDGQKRVVAVNGAFSQITGFKFGQLLGKTALIFDKQHVEPDIVDSIETCLETSGKWQGEVCTKKTDGTNSHKEVSIIALRQKGEIYRYIVILLDITERKKNQQTIYLQANYDELTGLPNRNLFKERAAHTIAQCRRKASKFALLFIDIDNFKRINDNLGHAVGDALLKEIASRLNLVTRDCDTVSRFGGDEFIIIMENITSNCSFETIIRKINQCMSEAVVISGKTLYVSGSVGISMYPDDGEDISTLIRRADMAMYKAKDDGKNTYYLYEDKMNEEIHEYLEIETRLREAIAKNEFSLAYQPILDLRTGDTCSLEALVRWNQAELGIISPDKFIPVAEESGLIISIGEWILQQACLQLAEWNATINSNMKINVNISTRQFRDVNFGPMLSKVIDDTGINPQNLNLEITESLFLDDRDSRVFTLLQELQKSGISISLDDFGTGYSSLSYLKRFPVNILKIDRAFINDISSDSGDQSLVKAIISMAKSLNIRVVAEGVENKIQLDILRSYGCDSIQGYYYSKPGSPEDIIRLLTPARAS